ncbi:hypothetical protein C7212DRAFT_359605 [Tuber magnatum]|uniref:Uncharacterized protein n=1 Tax=Tuber magnatum TaxID=42249 RepID=A0A317SG43_9PEZI|nr:hypothetical protein C7212DRAFT_359605 [Tuber magnatum]
MQQGLVTGLPVTVLPFSPLPSSSSPLNTSVFLPSPPLFLNAFLLCSSGPSPIPFPPKRPPSASLPRTPSPPRAPPVLPSWTPINEPPPLPSSPSPSPEPSDNDGEVEHLSPKAIHRRIDLRPLWSIGLDLLLRKPTTTTPANANTERAIEYLNRLILFYPYRPRIHAHHPAIISTARRKEGDIGRTVAASALEFYPALFRLRVMQPGGLEKVREEIEELMLTPPWPDMVGLWLMKGMVLNAIADEERDLGRKEELRAGAEECFDAVRERGGEVPEEVVWEEGMDDVEVVTPGGDEDWDDDGYDERMDDSG